MMRVITLTAVQGFVHLVPLSCLRVLLSIVLTNSTSGQEEKKNTSVIYFLLPLVTPDQWGMSVGVHVSIADQIRVTRLLHKAGLWQWDVRSVQRGSHSPGATPGSVSGRSYDISGGQVGHHPLIVMMSQEHLHTWRVKRSPSRVMWGCWSLSRPPPGCFGCFRTFQQWDGCALLMNQSVA